MNVKDLFGICIREGRKVWRWWCNYFSNIMKSQEQADATYKNPCNRSSAKYQYSFGKEQRFKQRILKTEILDKFYDLPSQISRRGAIFGRDKRDCDRPSHIDTVPSWNYNPKEPKSTANIVFAPGREVPSFPLRPANTPPPSTPPLLTTPDLASIIRIALRASPRSLWQEGPIQTTRPSALVPSITSSLLCWIETRFYRRRSEREAAASCYPLTKVDWRCPMYLILKETLNLQVDDALISHREPSDANGKQDVRTIWLASHYVT